MRTVSSSAGWERPSPAPRAGGNPVRLRESEVRHPAQRKLVQRCLISMQEADDLAIDALVRHYQLRLAARDDIGSRVRSLLGGESTTGSDLGFGLADRTLHKLTDGRGVAERKHLRRSWRHAGLLTAGGQEALNGCLVLVGDPRPAHSARCLGLPVSHLEDAAGPEIRMLRKDAGFFLLSGRCADGVVTVVRHPLEAAMARALGVPTALAVYTQPTEGLLAALVVALRDYRCRKLRLVLGSASGSTGAAEMLQAAAERVGASLVASNVPIGNSLLSLRRIHGVEAVARFLSEGACTIEHHGSMHRVFGAVAVVPGAQRRTRARSPLERDLAEFSVHLAARGLSAAHIARISQSLEVFRRSCNSIGVRQLDWLTDTSLRTVQASWVSQSTGVSAGATRSSVVRRLSAVRLFLRWVHRIGRASTDLSQNLERLRPIAPTPTVVLSAREIERVLACIPAWRPCGLRDRAMMELLYSTGLRRGELVALDIGDVDLERRVISIRRGKGGTARTVPVGARALSWTSRYVETARVRTLTHALEPALFLSGRGRRVTAKSVTTRMRACLVAAGIQKSGSCHVFRHSCATLMHDAGADIRDLQAMLGHALLTSTQLYTRVSMQRLQLVHARTHPAEQTHGGG